MNIRSLLEAGQVIQDAEHAAGEVFKLGNLRGGSAGVIGTDGKIYGECHRVALARKLGQDKKPDSNRSIMFDAGNAAEDIWAAKLKAAGVEFKREEEIGIGWTVPGTTQLVTGRPDIVIGKTVDGVFIPEHGIELKGVYSASTGMRVECEGVPDAKHLAQAGFYSMALGGLPYSICYTNPSVIDTPFWAQKKLGAPKKLQPFYRIFDLRWTADTLEYRDERKTEWIATKYTKGGIADYFAMLVRMEQDKTLEKRPDGGYATGEDLPFNRCNYCALQPACDAHEADFAAWMSKIAE